MNISATDFVGNYAQKQGGAIFAQGFSYLKIDQGSSILNNYAEDKGDDLYIVNTEEPLELDEVKIENPNAKTSMYIEKVELIMNKVTVKNIYSNPLSVKGAALACFDCNSIRITQSTFINLRSILGGAIFIQENENKKKELSPDNRPKYLLHQNLFINNTAITGGAIYIDNPQLMTISNSTFQYNSAILPIES